MKDWQATFEDYRRDRRKRRAQNSTSLRPGIEQSAVLEQLAAAEQSELQNERLTREMREFFAEATRTAAAIMSRLTDQHEELAAEKLGGEIEDFLGDIIRRAETFMRAMQSTGNTPALQELIPQMRNLAGMQLDEFRSEGTAQLENKHIGEDPFGSEDEGSDEGGAGPRPTSVPSAEGGSLLGRMSGRGQEPNAEADEPPAAPRARRRPRRTAPAPEPEPAADAPDLVSTEPLDDDWAAPADEVSLGDDHDSILDERAAEPEPPPPAAPAGVAGLLDDLSHDPARLKRALAAMVVANVLSEEDARALLANVRR